MEFVFDIRRMDNLADGTPQGWQVRLLDGQTEQDFLDPATQQPLLPAPRQLGVISANTPVNPLGLFPLPPPDDVAMIPPDENASPYAQYCASTNSQVLSNAYEAIIKGWGNTAGSIDVVSFGRYLFMTLMGPYTENANGNTGLWADIQRAAGAEPVLLTLRADSPDTAINRLPWEMMHAGPQGVPQGKPTYFLAQQPQVSIARQVRDAPASFSADFKSPPSVLFVVGLKRTDQGLIIDEAIRPGAEYLSLVRGVEQEGLALKTHLLLEATPDSLGQAVANLRPSIVHFTCHGGYNEENGVQTGVLYLVSNDGKGTEKVSAGALLPKLGGVQIVVLNACNTASQIVAGARQVGQVAVPMAVELIKGGIPVVLGMAGQVADDACRLFTRRFYEALLNEGNLAQAAAEGRRVGIIGQGSANANTTADWGFPALFTSSGVKGGQVVVTPPTQEEKNWLKSASKFTEEDFPTFCDRIDYFRWYNMLMAEPETQVALALPGAREEIRTLSISVSEANFKKGRKLWGRTWLLHHLAAEAARNGHLPWLLTENTVVASGAITDAGLIKLLHENARHAAGIVGIDELPTWTQLLALDASGVDPATLEAFSPAMRLSRRLTQYKLPENSLSDGAQAFWEDMVEYIARLRGKYPWLAANRRGSKLLILIDDVHLMDQTAINLLDAILKQGVGVLTKDVRVVFTYADVSNDAQTDGTPMGASRAKKLEEGKVGVKSCRLGPFGRPEEEIVAYKQFLYYWRNPDAGDADTPLVASEGHPITKIIFKRLEAKVEGIPGYLKSKGSDVVATYYDQNNQSDPKFFKVADDEARLRDVRNLMRGVPGGN